MDEKSFGARISAENVRTRQNNRPIEQLQTDRALQLTHQIFVHFSAPSHDTIQSNLRECLLISNNVEIAQSAAEIWINGSQCRGLELVAIMQKLHRNDNLKPTAGFSIRTVRRLITHAGCIATGVGRAFSRVCLFVCLFVRALKGKRLELSTPYFVHVYSIVVARHALTQRSKDQRSKSHGSENRHGRTAAPVLLWPCATAASVGLCVDTTAYVFQLGLSIKAFS